VAEVVRNLKKQGAKNKEINQSIKEVMKTIMENREEKKKLIEEKKKEKKRRQEAEGKESNEISE